MNRNQVAGLSILLAAILLLPAVMEAQLKQRTQASLILGRVTEIKNQIDISDSNSILNGIRDLRALLRADPGSYELNWRLAELFTVLGKYHESEIGRQLQIFEEAIRFGRKAMGLRGDLPEGHFRYAVAVGAWGLTNGPLHSLHLVPTFVREIEACAKTAPHGTGWNTVYADCHRLYAKLLYEVPRFPISVGDLNLAVTLLNEVVGEQPDFADNFVYMAELNRKLERWEEMQSLLDTAEDLIHQQQRSGYRVFIDRGWEAFDVNKLRFFNQESLKEIARLRSLLEQKILRKSP